MMESPLLKSGVAAAQLALQATPMKSVKAEDTSKDSKDEKLTPKSQDTKVSPET